MKLKTSIIVVVLFAGCTSIPEKAQDANPVINTGSTDHKDIVYDTIEQDAYELYNQQIESITEITSTETPD